MLKRILIKRYGNKLAEMSWNEVFDDEFKKCMLLIDLLLTIPSTSVSCETTFSQMKLVKTSRRTKLQNSTLNNLLTVKLQSPDINSFQPDKSIDIWLSSALKPRKVNYKRRKPEKVMAETPDIIIHEEEETSDYISDSEYEDLDDMLIFEEKDLADYMSEEDVFDKLIMFTRD